MEPFKMADRATSKILASQSGAVRALTILAGKDAVR